MGPAEWRRSPPAPNGPCLSHLLAGHVTHASGAAGSGESAARSSPKSSDPGALLRWCGLPSESSGHVPSSRSLYDLTSHTCGIGTKRFLLSVPTLFSTEPFSLPERGLVKL